MEPKPSRKSRGHARPSPGPVPTRPAESRFKESSGWPLWLFPGAAGLRSALLRRLETTRQVCCRLGRLVVLERGGAGVEVHPLPADRDGARKPKCIKLGRKMKIHSMDQGAEHLLILSSDGKPFEYNYSIEHARFQSILQEKVIIQITCGDYHSLALSKGGELFAWGQNLHGQLGIGEMCPSVPVPQIVEHLAGVPLLQISAGEAHSMALSMAGNTYSWGKNDMGQLGLGHTQNEDSPCLIEALDNQKIEFVACGGSHTVLLTQDGKLFTFGAGKCGQLGHNSKRNELKPRLVTELVGKRVTQIVCGRWHTLAYAAGLGKVFSFGSGKEGQLGSRGTQNQLIPRPMKLSPNGELKFESRTSEKELIMIAGGNQSILLWMDKKNSYVNLRRKIPTMNESTIKRWIADVGTKQWQNTKREIREIFTSSACLTGSFLRQRLAVEPTSVHLDLNIARSAFKELTQKDWITNTVVALRLLFEEENTLERFLQEPKISEEITTCLRDNLLKNLPVHSPHKEALEIFFILPECPVMHACNNWESLVIPFADAIYKLSDQSSMVLEEYWTTLPEAAFSRVVQMVRSAVASRLRYWTESTESNHQVKVLLEVLKKLHRCYQIMEAGEFAKEARDLECSEASLAGFCVLLVMGSWDKGKDVVEESYNYDYKVNQTTCQVPEEEFVVDELLDWLNFYGEAYRQHCRKADMETSAEEQNSVSFSNFSFLFNTLTKIKLLYADSLLKIQEKRIQACIRLAGFMEGEDSELAFVPTFNLTVRRNHLIEDVLNQLTQFENEDLRRELWVSFTGEIGFGFRGVMTEFFYCLFEEMTQPEYGLFTYPEEASCMWFPVKPKFEEKRYYFFGMLCGLSLFNCNVANLPFPLALFKKLLGQNPSLEDLKELSPVLGKSLQFLLDNESSDFEEIFYIHFNIHWDSKDVDLIPNGSCVIVNQTNKSDYISKCVNYIFNISVKEVYDEFQRGFYKVCNKEIIQCFRPGELKDAIVGNTDFDWETFEKNARYEQGYSSSHPTIVMFWEALHKLSPEEKKKFLVFLTGTDRTQIKNLKNVQITFLCPEHLNEKDPMQAQTSFCLLYLPKYSTMERVEEALQFAISNNRGFG